MSFIGAVFDRVDALIKERAVTDQEVLGFFRSAMPQLRMLQIGDADAALAAKEIVDKKIPLIASSLKADAVFGMNPNIDAVLGIAAGYFRFTAGLNGIAPEAAGALARSTYSDADRAELTFSVLRVQVVAGNMTQVEYALRTISALNPQLTPEARMIVAGRYKGLADVDGLTTAQKKDLLRKAVSHWPSYLEAHEALQAIYEKENKTIEKDLEGEIIGRIKAQKAGERRPAEMRWSRKQEVIRHVLTAPLTERALYFLVPISVVLVVGAAFLGTEALGLAPLGFAINTLLAGAQIPFIRDFVKRHEGGRGAAWVVSAASFALPLVLDMAPVYYVLVALGLHAAINLTIFTVNTLSRAQIINYATTDAAGGLPTIPATSPPQAPTKPAAQAPAAVPEVRPSVAPPAPAALAPISAPTPAIAPRIMIGIVGVAISQESLESLSKKYGGAQFVPLKEGGEAATRELEAVKSEAKVRVVVDLGSITKTIDEMGKIVDMAKIQSFAIDYPRLVALNASNISLLSRDNLGEVFDILAASLPQARSIGADTIITNSFTNVAPAAPVEGRYTDFSNRDQEEAWFDRYAAAEKAGDAAKLDALRSELLNFLKGKSPAEIRSILGRHEAIATARYWNEKGAPREVAAAMVDGIVEAGNKPCVLAFDARMLTPAAFSDIDALAKEIKVKGAKISIVIFGTEPIDRLPAVFNNLTIAYPTQVRYMQRSEATITEQIKLELKDATSVSIALERGVVEGLADVKADMGHELAPAYVALNGLTEQEQKDKFKTNIVMLNAASLRRAISDKRPSFTGLGVFDENKFTDIKDIRTILAGLGGLFTMVTDVGKAISQIFQAIKATAISV